MTHSVDLKVLREFTNQIFDFIERDLQIQAVELPHNLYWEIFDDALYTMEQQPSELGCGSLVDDFEFVEDASKDPAQAIPLMLMHVAPLLKALSTAVPSYKSPAKE